VSGLASGVNWACKPLSQAKDRDANRPERADACKEKEETDTEELARNVRKMLTAVCKK